MEITLFKGVTYTEQLEQLKTKCEEYTGLYVDMNNAPERKFVKEHQGEIAGIRKRLDRVRIDLKKEYAQSVESEFEEIDLLLAKYNEPFDLLLNEYKAERKKILDAEKARKQAILDAAEIERDHEFALLMNSTWELDQAEAKRKQEEYEKQIAEQAAKDERDRLERLNKAQEQERINEENARIANREHTAKINREIVSVLTHYGLTDEHAKVVVRLAVHGKLPNVKINY